ncbi:iron ABC transporter permease [Ferrovibrio sp.]|uniref:ABC transporter permease n=1 Tax=Ferrovibrio sp. TaxID=1917215 RepID=UPI0025C48944|nr:iron ABC transporter permease [Ferrovibrio sp.]
MTIPTMIEGPDRRSAGQGVWGWIALGLAGLAVVPWYALGGAGIFSAGWFGSFPSPASAPAIWQIWNGKPWLLLPALPLLGAFAALFVPREQPLHGRLLACSGMLGLALLLAQGFAIDHRGPTLDALQHILSVSSTKQSGLGAGAALLGFAHLMLFARGLSRRGFCRGDAFTVGAITLIVTLIALFVFFPVLVVLLQAFTGPMTEMIAKTFDASIWSLACILGPLRCGVAWNTLFLAIVVGAGTTLLGLAFALIAVRTGFRFKPVLRILTVLPIITPPFVIGLALILLFGRSGAVTALMMDWFDIPRSRWIYGFTGIAIAQLLAFTPIAFLVLIGVVQGVAPSLEEAAQTLRANRWAVFRTVTWPLLRPGIANAFLLGFVESLADFGNPLVLGGSYDVLATKIFFAIVGASHDESRAAILAMILLVFTLLAFWAQQHWLGNKSYTTVTGKGDSGLPAPLPRNVSLLSYALALPWALFTVVIYVTIFFGGFVKAVGRDHSFTLSHYLAGFAIEWGASGLLFSGSAWGSFGITLWISAIAAPLTAGIGVLTAYLLTRQQFTGRRAFEFGTMLSFAIPGTVIGISYVLAFNVPPLELTGTGIILVICFVFRNMPVGVRAGIASLSQIDKSLDEASLTLGAGAAGTFRRITMPLLRPAITAALIYSFVRAMTAVSAIIFLVTAQYNMATAYIVGRVEAGELGLAIAYSSVLILVMVLAIGVIQLAVGERRIGRRSIATTPIPTTA